MDKLAQLRSLIEISLARWFGAGRVLLFFSATALATPGAAQTMQNPLLSGVNQIEVACLFQDDNLDSITKNRICDLIVGGASQMLDLPATRVETARPVLMIDGGTIRVGIFWIEARFATKTETSESVPAVLFGQLSWGNSKPMRGVAVATTGDEASLVLHDDIAENERQFVSNLLNGIGI